MGTHPVVGDKVLLDHVADVLHLLHLALRGATTLLALGFSVWGLGIGFPISNQKTGSCAPTMPCINFAVLAQLELVVKYSSCILYGIQQVAHLRVS